MPKSLFEPSNIETFMGGEFRLPSDSPKTVGELKACLRAWLKELADWGDDAEPLAECALVNGRLSVTMEKGIVQ